jgi:SAM-dependent methyltransferase
MSDTPRILDATCGGRTIWMDEHKENDNTIYIDRRQEEPGFHGQEGRTYAVQPDIIADNREIPFQSDTFDLAVYDPPYKTLSNGMKGIDNAGRMDKKYGVLHAETWQDDLNRAFCELFRVLNSSGALVFKFQNVHQPWEKILNQLPVDPLFGTTTKKRGEKKTRWFTLHASQYNPDLE